MSADIFASLEAIRHFLIGEVASQVPPQLRAEVRATGKLLRDIIGEIDALPALVEAECKQMLELCDLVLSGPAPSCLHAEVARIRRQNELPMATLSGQLRLHDELRGHVGAILVELIEAHGQMPATAPEREANGRRIKAICHLLARQADARMHWQSVFPALPTGTITISQEQP